jgi:putative endopeptidase
MLSLELQEIVFKYEMALTGQPEMDDPQKLAYRLAYSFFDEPVGIYYAQNYFGEKAKQDVTSIVEQLADVYKGRLKNNDWLGEETIAAALRKLDKISLQIGYPDKISPVYDLINIVPYDEGGTVFSNMVDFNSAARKDNLAKCGQETDHTEWSMSAATVNAYYDPQSNTIVFPAAILQKPFYSPDYSSSRNLGAIGAIIGHEITHAFDPMGSMFDEYGSLANWWTEADHAAFEEKTGALIAQFDGVEYLGTRINGRQVITEVVGDAGGLSSSLEVCEAQPDADPKAFFEGWATAFREKVRPELQELIINTSAYPPHELRVNMQVRNLDAFYEAYSVVEGDALYLAPEDRASVW